jgi:hypothetical protein
VRALGIARGRRAHRGVPKLPPDPHPGPRSTPADALAGDLAAERGRSEPAPRRRAAESAYAWGTQPGLRRASAGTTEGTHRIAAPKQDAIRRR